MKRILYIATLWLLLPLLAEAQVTKQVEVTKDYTPSVGTAQKLSLVPDMTDTVMMRPDIDYTITPRSFETTLMTEHFKPATITYWDYTRKHPLYVKAAAGVPLQSLADVYLSTYNKDRGYAMVYLNHLGDYRNRYNLLGEKVKKTTEMSNRAGGRAGLFVGPRMLEVDVLGDMQHRHRYPSTGELIDFGRAEAKLRFGDDFKDLSRWNFNIEAGGAIFLDDRVATKLNETNLHGEFKLGKMLGNNLLQLQVRYDGAFGQKGLEWYKNHIAMAGVRYGLHTQRFEFLVGADYYYDKIVNSNKSPHHIFPYLRMGWKNSSDGFVPYVEVDGGVKRNDYATLIYENPFIATDADAEWLKQQILDMGNRTEYNARVGFGGVLGRGVFAYNLSAELSFADNNAYWYSDGASYYFDNSYQHRLTVEAMMRLRLASWFEAEINAKGRVWESEGKMYSHDPKLNASLALRYIGRRLTVGVKPAYVSSSRWMVKDVDKYSYITTKGYFDLGLQAEYRITERWVAFAEGRNLTGSNIHEWLNYYRSSVEGMLGVKFTF